MNQKNGYLNVLEIHPRKVLFVYLSHPYNSDILDSKVAYKTYDTVP